MKSYICDLINLRSPWLYQYSSFALRALCAPMWVRTSKNYYTQIRYFSNPIIKFRLQAGMFILQLLDWYSSAIAVIVICLVEIIMVAYIYGIEMFRTDVEFMLGQRPSIFWKITWKFITPLVMLVREQNNDITIDITHYLFLFIYPIVYPIYKYCISPNSHI